MLHEDSADLVHFDAKIGRLERSGVMICWPEMAAEEVFDEVREDGLGAPGDYVCREADSI